MPALIGYMVVVVVMLGGYLTGLHWLVSPPDVWQPHSQAQLVVKKRPHVPPVPSGPAYQPVTVAAPAVAVEAPAEPPAAVQQAAVLPVVAEKEKPAAVVQLAKLTPSSEPANSERATPTPRSALRNRAEKKPARRPVLMVLRTYERSDGTRFSRLLPMGVARQASYQAADW